MQNDSLINKIGVMLNGTQYYKCIYIHISGVIKFANGFSQLQFGSLSLSRHIN